MELMKAKESISVKCVFKVYTKVGSYVQLNQPMGKPYSCLPVYRDHQVVICVARRMPQVTICSSRLNIKAIED